jgi:ABC-type nitrate/sulfonate/bicarbonate transport system permease component
MHNGSSTLVARPPILATPPKVRHALLHTTGFHVSKISTGTIIVGVLAMVDSAIIAALIAGAFTLVNTILTVWLTGLKRERRPPRARRQRRRQRPEQDTIEQDALDDDS